MVLKKYTLCSIDTLIKVISSLKLVFTDTGFCCQGDVQASVFLAHAGNAVVCDVVSGPSGRIKARVAWLAVAIGDCAHSLIRGDRAERSGKNTRPRPTPATILRLRMDVHSQLPARHEHS